MAKTLQLDALLSKVTTKREQEAINAASIEKPEHRIAFDTYYKLGDKRTVRKLAEVMDKSEGTLLQWSRKYKWSERVALLEEQELSLMDSVEMSQKELRRWKDLSILVDGVIDSWFDNFSKGYIKMRKGVADLEKLVNLRARLVSLQDASSSSASAVGADGGDKHMHLHNTNINFDGMDTSEMYGFIKDMAMSMDRVMTRKTSKGEDIVDVDTDALPEKTEED